MSPSMVRKVHSEGVRERNNMKNHTRKNGEWCVIGFCEDWDGGCGIQGWRYESKAQAQEVKDELDQDEEFDHVDEHKVMKHDEFKEYCQENGVDRDTFPF